MIHIKKLRKTEKQKLLDDNRGILSEIAADIGCDSSLVSRVFWGKATSRKVHEAIEKRMDGLEVAAR